MEEEEEEERVRRKDDETEKWSSVLPFFLFCDHM